MPNLTEVSEREQALDEQLGKALDLLSRCRDTSLGAELANEIDALLNGEESDHDDEIVTRSAPRWAWEVIDETLSMDSQSKAFDPELREQIGKAYEAMIEASEAAED